MKDNYEIDFVIPWVDGSDQEWQKEKFRYSQIAKQKDDSEIFDNWNSSDIRFRDWDNLQYLFRGIEKFAPWVRTVHFVTCGHLPKWLDTSNPKLHIVKHEDYIPKEYLPTFNSHTIELNFHKIEGLAEHFVYFNDDMFITKPLEKSDLFSKGLPCCTAVLNPIPVTRNVTNAAINNIGILNDRFKKNEVIKKNWTKWFSLKYGPYIIRNFLLLPWNKFVGILEQHIPSSFIKSTFETVWKEEHETLDKACRDKFRNYDNVNQWIFSNWQVATGQFMPRSTKLGKFYALGEDNNYDEVYEAISKQKYKLCCVNDSNDIDDFELRKELLLKAFDSILPEKSSFEKEVPVCE